MSNVVEYALADKNCKLRVKAKSRRYYHFNSQEELATIAIRLQNENVYKDFRKDEKEDELFY